jgi:hypothetical protein
MSIVLCLNTQLTWKGCGARGSTRPRDKERRPLNRWWSCCRKLLAACTPGFGSWQDHSPSVTLRVLLLASSKLHWAQQKAGTDMGEGNQYPLQGGGRCMFGLLRPLAGCLLPVALLLITTSEGYTSKSLQPPPDQRPQHLNPPETPQSEWLIADRLWKRPGN